MAITSITMGGAHSSETGGKHGVAGDQKQVSIPDNDGEVSLKVRDQATLLKYFGSYTVYRPTTPELASALCRPMIAACNNKNIGYSQNGRSGIFTYGADSTVPTNCDCSSLVTYCARECGLNVSKDSYTGDLGEHLLATGQFMAVFKASSYNFVSNTPYNGDILIKAGSHTEMIVAGNPREGSADEITTGTYTANGDQLQWYLNSNYESQQFTKRTTEPISSDELDKYYDQTYGVTKMGSYAWGRFSEIMHQTCNLARSAPRNWYEYKEDGYPRSVAPSLGAVMCFTNIYDNNDAGLAYIVEEIQSDSIFVSYRDPSSGGFKTSTFKKRAGSWDMDFNNDGKYEYVFQGFIYNPYVDTRASAQSALETFISNAKNAVGKTGEYVKQYIDFDVDNQPWSGAFIAAVATQSGSLLNVILPNTTSCSDIGSQGVVRNMGTWFDGPMLGGNPNPMPGDIVFLRFNKYEDSNNYRADKAGIVVEVDLTGIGDQGTNQDANYTFKAVFGDWDGSIQNVSYNVNQTLISGFFRPNWEQVDGTTRSVQQNLIVQGLYTEGVNLEDAMIRDLRYVKLTDKGFEYTSEKKGSMLCAINYSGMLGNLWSQLAQVGTSTGTNANLVVDLWTNTTRSQFQSEEGSYVSVISNEELVSIDSEKLESMGINQDGSVTVKGETMLLNDITKTIYSLLYEEIQNPAGVCGIMANMWQECRWDPTEVNNSDGGSGLIQWTNTGKKSDGTYSSPRADNMKAWCRTHGNGNEWYNNISGQISFLWHECDGYSHYKEGIDKVKAVTRDQQGARDACKVFLKYLELGKNQWGTEKETRELSTRYPFADACWKLFFGNL